MAALLQLFGGGGNSGVAAEAQCLRNGKMFIQLLPESNQIAFGVEGDKKIPPIVFDLKTGTIINAQFPQAPEEVSL
jgi:hypothetical protein